MTSAQQKETSLGGARAMKARGSGRMIATLYSPISGS